MQSGQRMIVSLRISDKNWAHFEYCFYFKITPYPIKGDVYANPLTLNLPDEEECHAA
jgi:hypothetical protein